MAYWPIANQVSAVSVSLITGLFQNIQHKSKQWQRWWYLLTISNSSPTPIIRSPSSRLLPCLVLCRSELAPEFVL